MSTIDRKLTGGCLLAVAAASLVCPPPAAAQQRHYRVIELGVLPGGTFSEPFGINDDGVVVGQGDIGTEMHAFVWLPAPLYGFNCGDPRDLHVLAPGTPTGDSIGYEVNTTLITGGPMGDIPAAQIAGQAGGNDGYAFVWTLANGDATTTNLNDYAGSGVEAKVAWSINDAAPAVVAGDIDRFLPDCHDDLIEVTVGFRATLDTSISLEFLSPFGDDNASFARDINTAASADVVGFSDAEDPFGQCVGPSGCDEQKDALIYKATATIELDRIIPAWGGQPRGINDAGDVVGRAADQSVNPNNCVSNATLWRAPNHDLVVLGDQCPLGVASSSVANAIADITPLQIVGINSSTTRALLWEEIPGCGGSDWDVVDLDLAACDCTEDFILVEAMDINDSGWIVARGFAGAGVRAFLLRPIEDCPSDLDGDGFVGQPDLSILLGNWTGDELCGNCDDLCCECNGDTNGDCHVGVIDLLALLGAWATPCPGFGICAGPESAATGPGLEESVQALGFDSVKECQSWLQDASQDQAFALGLVLKSALAE